MTSTRQHEIRRQAPEESSNEPAPEAVQGEGPRIAEIAVPNAITLPVWFSGAQACAVLRLKVRSFVLLAGAHGIDRVASRADLSAAPPEQSVSGSAVPLGPGVTPSTSVAEAVRLMNDRAVDHVAVVVAGAVLGIVTREDAVRALAFGPPPRPRAALASASVGTAAAGRRPGGKGERLAA